MTLRVVLTALLVALVTLLTPARARAQGASAAGAGRPLEVAAGGGWFTGSALGNASANLRRREGGDYVLFATESRLTGGPVLDVRAAYALSRRYAVEARFGLSRPDLRTDVSADVEGAPPITIAERLDRYVVDGALVILFGDIQRDALVPFASAGAGYLRELHEGRTLVEQGIAYHAGGGVKHAFFTRNRRAITAAGVRGDARLYVLAEGAAGDVTTHLSLTAGVFVAF